MPITLTQGLDTWYSSIDQFAFHPDTHLNQPLVKPFVQGIARMTPPKTVVQYFQSVLGVKLDLSQLRMGEPGGVDARLIMGDYETGAPKGILTELNVTVYKKAFQGREDVISGAGHFCILENPEQVAEALGRFLGAK